MDRIHFRFTSVPLPNNVILARDGKMATYMKPTSKLFDLPSHASAELNLTDLMCPVCRGILIEPVTLPCAHSLCLRCLNGTVQHNSLSCPLCRVRVGSWLRTATKSDTLVNSGLWKSIKTRFAKEVQAKNAGEETPLDSGFVTTNKILSATGEIRREYEAQLQIAEEEMRRQREIERKASEELIRKIHEEERSQMAQLTQDQSLAKSFVKKEKGKGKFANERLKLVESCFDEKKSATNSNVNFTRAITEQSSSLGHSSIDDVEQLSLIKSKDGTEWKSNIALISKIRAERYASSMKSNIPNVYKTTSETLCYQNAIVPQNSAGRPIKHEIITKIHLPTTSDYLTQPGCSNSKIYGTQSKEELHVPSDVLNRKRKSLGVEVCLTANASDERIGSAESSGSHDSINIEIHHFKPIKAMPRTPLKSSTDGRQVDPKLIRVVAIFKRVQNAVLKPPMPMQLKRLSGCSYSAFKGKSKKAFMEIDRSDDSISPREKFDKKASTSQIRASIGTNKLVKPQNTDTARRLDLSSEAYSKNVNTIINGTRVSKKLILDDDAADRSMETEMTDDRETVTQSKLRRNSSASDQDTMSDGLNSDDDASSRNSSLYNANPSTNHRSLPLDTDHVPAVENIAERIKKRKMCNPSSSDDSAKIDTSQKPLKQRRTMPLKKSKPSDVQLSPVKSQSTSKRKVTMKIKTQNQSKSMKSLEPENDSVDSSENSDWAVDNHASVCSGKRKSTRTSNRRVRKVDRSDTGIRRSTRNVAKDDSVNNNNKKATQTAGSLISKPDEEDANDTQGQDESDEEIVKEQKRMERLVLQEKEDFELAQRLQAQFNEMERISGRTRNSRRGIDTQHELVDNYSNRNRRNGRGDVNANNCARTLKTDQETLDASSKKRRRTQRRLVK